MEDVDVVDFQARLQLPEAIVAAPEVTQGKGVDFLRCQSGSRIILHGTGSNGDGASITRTGRGRTLSVGPAGSSAAMIMSPLYLDHCASTAGFSTDVYSGIWQLSIERLAPHRTVEIEFVTSNVPPAARTYRETIADLEADHSPVRVPRGQLFYVAASFNYDLAGRTQPRTMGYALSFDGSRIIGDRSNGEPVIVSAP